MSKNRLNLKKILEGVKNVRVELEGLLTDRAWVKEARKLAERQGKDLKKTLDSDVAKLRAFLEEERKELEKLQAQIPGEVAKIKKFVDAQKSELSSLLKRVKKTSGAKKRSSKSSSGKTKKKTAKKASSKKAAGPKSSGPAS
jgi:hypothetical protein